MNSIGVSGATECFQRFVNRFEFQTVLDVGCGMMPYKKIFKDKKYLGMDMRKADYPDYVSFNFMSETETWPTDEKYDAVVSAHVVEHIQDTKRFIDKMVSLTAPGGKICIIWPKPKPNIVGGHVHVFNIGMMYYNIILTGQDCSKWQHWSQGYSQVVMGEVSPVDLTPLKLEYDKGDIEKLAKYFPFKVYQGFNGNTLK